MGENESGQRIGFDVADGGRDWSPALQSQGGGPIKRRAVVLSAGGVYQSTTPAINDDDDALPTFRRPLSCSFLVSTQKFLRHSLGEP